MRIEQIMGADIRRCGNGDRLQDAARAMLRLGCDTLPICGTDGRRRRDPVGITERVVDSACAAGCC